MMGAKFISSIPLPVDGGAVNIPGFQAFGEDLINVTRASAAMWLTLVTDAQRPAFEAAALAAAARIDPSGALASQGARARLYASSARSLPDAAAPRISSCCGGHPCAARHRRSDGELCQRAATRPIRGGYGCPRSTRVCSSLCDAAFRFFCVPARIVLTSL
jgi:hypothetical protein